VTTDGTDAFFASWDSPTKLVKFTGDTNQRSGALALTGLTNVWNSITYFNGNIFVGDYQSSPTNVVKVAASTMTKVGSTLTLNAGETYGYGMVNDGSTFAYLASWGPGAIVKIKMSDLTRVGAITLTDTAAQDVAIDAKYLYVALDGGSGQKQVTRVILSTFLEDASIAFSAGETDSYSVIADSTASTSAYVYVGMDVNPGIIVKVSVATWARVFAKVLNSAGVYDLVFDATLTNIYALTDANPFTIVQVKVSDLSVVTTLIGDLDEQDSYFMGRVGNSLFVGSDTSPAKSVKFAIDGPAPQAPNTTAAPLSVGATESKIVAALVALISVVFVMA